MEKRTLLSIATICLGFVIFGSGVYVFHYFYHPLSTLLLAVTGGLLINVGIAYLCEQEETIKGFLRVGLKRTKDIKKKIPRKRKAREPAEG